MCSIIYNISKACLDYLYDCFWSKTDKNDNKIFPPSQINDGFKLMYDGSEIFWCEWWTLYFYGTSEDKIYGMVNYIFIKGLNHIGRCIVYPAISINGKKYTQWDIYNLKDFSNEDDKIHISDNIIEMISNKEFKFIGNTFNKDISWNLNAINNKYDPLYVAQKIKVGVNTSINIPVNQTLSFISLLPTASVNGTITVNNVEYPIKLSGEVQHLWGPVILPTINWNLLSGSDVNNNLIYWLHGPATSTVEEKGCVYLNIDNKKYFLRDYDVTEYITDKEYPDKLVITALYEDITIEYNVFGPSASDEGSASENHVGILIKINNKEYTLCGIAEYHRANFNKLDD